MYSLEHNFGSYHFLEHPSTNLVKNCRQEEHHGARLWLEQCEHFQDERAADGQDVQGDGDLGEVEGAHD